MTFVVHIFVPFDSFVVFVVKRHRRAVCRSICDESARWQTLQNGTGLRENMMQSISGR